MVTSKPKVLLFGVSGQGLFNVANMLVSGELLPCPLFKTGDGIHGMTDSTVASHEGRGYHVVTVGIGEETEIHWNGAIDLIFKSLTETQLQGVEYSHILFVMPESWFDQLDDDIWKLFLKIFEGAEPPFGLIVTECTSPKTWQIENEELLQEKYGKFILPGRYIYVDFRPIDEDEEMEGRWRLMRKHCLGNLDASLHHFFERNNFQYYKLPKYDTATASDCLTQLDIYSSPAEEIDLIEQMDPSKPIRKVLLFGKTGQGKSTIANMLVSGELLHDPVFKTGDGMRGVTDIVSSHEGRGYHVVDTVGIGEETESHRKHAANLIYQFLKETQGEYSHILFVTPAGRFDQLDEDISKLFPTIFKGAESAFGVVVTKCRNPKKWKLENEKLLREKYGKFILPGHYMYVDFPPLDEDEEMEHSLWRRRQKSLDSLETFLERFFAENEFQYYLPEYATATEAGLLALAKQLLLKIIDFVKFKIFRYRKL